MRSWKVAVDDATRAKKHGADGISALSADFARRRSRLTSFMSRRDSTKSQLASSGVDAGAFDDD